MNKKLLRAYARKMRAAMPPAERREVTDAEAEAEIVAVVTRVAENVSRNPKMVFGYHEAADIVQEGVVEALVALDAGRYDVSRPLENFMHVHIANRIKNLRRDTYMRLEPPCTCCEAFNPPPEPCRRWRDWHARNSNKQSLMRPVEYNEQAAAGRRGGGAAGDAADAELRELVDRGIPADLRGDYLRMLAGEPVPKGRRQRVREAALAALGDGAD